MILCIYGDVGEKTDTILAKDLIAFKVFAMKKKLPFYVYLTDSPAAKVIENLLKPLGVEQTFELVGSDDIICLVYETSDTSGLKDLIPDNSDIIYRVSNQKEAPTGFMPLLEDQEGSRSYVKYNNIVNQLDTTITRPNEGLKIYQQVDFRPGGWGAIQGDDTGRTF